MSLVEISTAAIALFNAVDKLSLFLLFSVGVLAYLLYRAQHTPDDFDLRDLIVDPLTHKVSLNKFGQFVALSISSWGFVYLVLHDKLSEIYFTTFMACWGGVTLVNNAIKAYSDKGPPLVDNVEVKEDNK